MGGFGSGNWCRFGTKPRADYCKHIDINQWQREGIIKNYGTMTWSWFKNGKCCSTIGLKFGNDEVLVNYKVNEETLNYRVSFVYTKTNFGRRAWFICPGQGCGRRVAKLYLREKYFLCRHCHNLSYNSRNQTDLQGLWRKLVRIGHKIGITNFNDTKKLILMKPKGMHEKTFCRLVCELTEIHSLYEKLANKRIEAIALGIIRNLA